MSGESRGVWLAVIVLFALVSAGLSVPVTWSAGASALAVLSAAASVFVAMLGAGLAVYHFLRPGAGG